MKIVVYIWLSIIFYCNLFANTNEYSLKINPKIIKPKIVLVLSGGGARGIAQIATIQELEKMGIEVDAIVGTSIGAVIGGLYASGYTGQQLKDLAYQSNWEEIFASDVKFDRADLFYDQKIVNDRNILTFRFKEFEFELPEAISVGTKFRYFLQDKIWSSKFGLVNDFNLLKIPFRAIASDLVSGNSISLSKGNLVTAIRASATVPLRFNPIKIDNLILVDGGLLANIPTEFANEFNPDIKILVNTTSPLLAKSRLNKPWYIADQVVSIAMKKLADSASADADIVISPNLGDLSNTDFSEIDLVYQQGKKAIDDVKYDLITKIDFVTAKIIDSIVTNSFLSKHDYPFVPNFINFEPILSKLLDNSGKSISKKELVSILKELYLSYDYKGEIDIRLVGDRLEIVSKSVTDFIKYNLKAKFNNDTNGLGEKLSKIFNRKGINYKSIKLIESEVLDIIYEYDDRQLSCVVSYESTNNLYNIEIEPIKIDEIKILGNDNTGENFILREIKGNEVSGDFNVNSLNSVWQKLLSTELFRDVDIAVYNQQDSVKVKIKVDEMGRQLVKAGVRIDNERFGQVSVDLIQENAFDTGTRIFARLGGGLRNQIVETGIENSRLFDLPFSVFTNAYYSSKNIYQYQYNSGNRTDRYGVDRLGEIVEERYGFKAFLGSVADRDGLITFGFRHEYQRVKNLITNTYGDFYAISCLSFNTVFDNRSKTWFNEDGSLLKFDFETTLLQESSIVGFTKANIEYLGAIDFFSGTLKPSFQLGFADATLPIPELFNMGGEDSFWGMREEEGRGRQIAKASLAWQYKLPFNLLFDTYYGIRYDTGAIWAAPSDIKFSTFRHGIGNFIGIDTPIGPAKFSLGRSFYFIKNPDSAVLGPVYFYFSLGMRI